MKYHQKIQKLRKMLKVEKHIPVRNVLISLLNDAIISKNRQTAKALSDENYSCSHDHNYYEILHQSPEMTEIISVRKYHSLLKLISMALQVKTPVRELNIFPEYN